MESKQEQYDSKKIKEWCKEFNETQEEYYRTRNIIWNMFAGIGNRKID